MHWGKTGEDWECFFRNSSVFNEATVQDVMNCPRNEWRNIQNASPLYETNTTFHALEKLAITRAKRAVIYLILSYFHITVHF
jgi:hypothetical protein